MIVSYLKDGKVWKNVRRKGNELLIKDLQNPPIDRVLTIVDDEINTTVVVYDKSEEGVIIKPLSPEEFSKLNSSSLKVFVSGEPYTDTF